MARITLDHLAHSYSADPRRAGGLRPEGDQPCLGAGRRLRAARPLRLRQDHASQHHLGPRHARRAGASSSTIATSRDLPTEARNIAQVFQFPVVYDTMTVRENLAFPLKNRARAARHDRRARRGDRPPARSHAACSTARRSNLTADMKQKISLGRGLVRPDVAAILFDEPLTVIDPHLKWQLRSTLKEMHRALDITMIYVTHDQTEALTFADKVVVMHDGARGADRHAGGAVRAPGAYLRRPFHRLAGHEHPALPGRGRDGLSSRARRSPLRSGYPTLAARPAHRARHPAGIRRGCGRRAGRAGRRCERIDDIGRARIARVEIGGRPARRERLRDGSPSTASEAALAFDPRAVHIYADGHLVDRRGAGRHGRRRPSTTGPGSSSCRSSPSWRSPRSCR